MVHMMNQKHILESPGGTPADTAVNSNELDAITRFAFIHQIIVQDNIGATR